MLLVEQTVVFCEYSLYNIVVKLNLELVFTVSSARNLEYKSLVVVHILKKLDRLKNCVEVSAICNTCNLGKVYLLAVCICESDDVIVGRALLQGSVTYCHGRIFLLYVNYYEVEKEVRKPLIFLILKL